MSARTEVDHLVVMAATLAEGVQWCETTLGITPGAGGQHALMGTHNRLFRLDGGGPPGAYFEIIALDPQAPPPQRSRWFDMDDPTLRASVARDGPQLIHWVTRVPDIDAAVAALHAQGIDRGEVLAAQRPTPAGPLHWRISVRADGQRLFDGCLPTLIEWGACDTVPHPALSLPASGVRLQAVTLQHPLAEALRAACDAVGLHDIALSRGAARLSIHLATPLGPRTLSSMHAPGDPS